MPSTVSAPLRVYPDSNDISNLATNHLFLDTRKALRDLVATGLLELRFSYFHIVELAQTNADAKPFSLQRAALVQELCGNKAFLHTDKLHRYEALSLVQYGETETAKGSGARAYVEDASWLPEWIVSIAHRFAGSLSRGLANRIASDWKREMDKMQLPSQEREFAQQHFLPDGHPSAELLKIVSDPGEYVAAWKQRFPLTDRFWLDNMPFEALRGQISEQELHEECVTGFGKIANFIGWCIDEIPSLRDLPADMRKTGVQNAELVAKLRDEADSLQTTLRNILDLVDPEESEGKLDQEIANFREQLNKVVSPDLARMRATELEDLFQGNLDWFAQHGVTRTEWDRHVASSPVGALPAFDAFLQVASAKFVDDVIDRQKKLSGKRSRSHSDPMDFHHCGYLPYVDVFRADRHLRAKLAKIAKDHGTILAPDIQGVPEMIRKLAHDRGLL
jgi:hypothetical protein